MSPCAPPQADDCVRAAAELGPYRSNPGVRRETPPRRSMFGRSSAPNRPNPLKAFVTSDNTTCESVRYVRDGLGFGQTDRVTLGNFLAIFYLRINHLTVSLAHNPLVVGSSRTRPTISIAGNDLSRRDRGTTVPWCIGRLPVTAARRRLARRRVSHSALGYRTRQSRLALASKR